MAKVVDTVAREANRSVFICDFSPPRSSDPALLQPAGFLDVSFICVAYNPGKSTRVNSAIAAHWIRANTGRDVVFNLATRDMNRIAAQSLLLGAELLELQNLVVIKGDALTEREQSLLSDVNDLRPTELIRSVNDMNGGVDFKGLKLGSPTDFCVGATIDLGRDIESELSLTRAKVEAGAQFFLSQPTFEPDGPLEFLERYADRHGAELEPPVFHGVQVMAPDSLAFGDMPGWITADLSKGRPGYDIALQVLQEFSDAALRSIYLVPPVFRGGRRDYEAAQALLEAFRS